MENLVQISGKVQAVAALKVPEPLRDIGFLPVLCLRQKVLKAKLAGVFPGQVVDAHTGRRGTCSSKETASRSIRAADLEEGISLERVMVFMSA